MAFTYDYARPMVTVDMVVLKSTPNGLELLLINRLNEPFKNAWALPGGFVDENEPLLHAAIRELEEETGISNIRLEQFKTYGDPGRDPRGHTVSVVYYTNVGAKNIKAVAGDDARLAQWFPVNQLPPLAFDHKTIITDLLLSLK